KFMKIFLFAFVLLVFSSLNSLFAQTQSSQNTHVLKGVVKTKDSAIISGLSIFFKNNERKTVVNTDINGEFSTELAPGSYELTVNNIISEQFIAFLNIQENGLNPSFIEFVIETNANYCGISSGDSCPRMLKFIKPVYPASALVVRLG